MTAPWLFFADALAALPDAEIGSKAAGLRRIMQAGLPTPVWGVLPCSVVQQAPWDDPQWDPCSLEDFFHRALAQGFPGLALRSSTDLEDGVEASHAGQFDTVFVRQVEELLPALKQVAASTGDSGAQMAVLAQALVAPQLAGVLFSADPAAAKEDQACLEIVFGLGDSLVGGAQTPSRFLLELTTGVTSVLKASKDAPAEVDPALAAKLIDALLRLESHWESALDIEWAWDGSQLWLLQARPITALSADASATPPCCATSWFFDQRFSKPISPLARDTLLRTVVSSAIEGALRLRHRPAPSPLLYYFGGQAYVPHEVYRRMLGGAPRWLMESDMRQLFPKQCCCPEDTPRWNNFFHYVVTAALALWTERGKALRTIHAWRQFRRLLPLRLESMKAPSLDSEESFQAQWDALDDLSQEFLGIHRWSILWANYAFRAFRALQRGLPSAWGAALEKLLHQNLRLPTVAANRALKAYLQGDLETADFLEAFGDRSGSLDLAEPTWAELAQSEALHERYAALVEAEFSDHQREAGFFRRLAYPLVRLVEMREEQRFSWEHILARQRKQVLAAARVLKERGALEKAAGVWLYQWQELLDALFRDTPLPQKELQLRQHRLNLEALIAKPTFIGPAQPLSQSKENQLQGVGASSGRVQGRAHLVRSTQELQQLAKKDYILVLACLDPAWTALLEGARGLVIERGGALSHAAILAREYGVPLVIGVENATQVIAENSLISLDGATGKIWIEEN